jgi:hypothetical protein
MSMAARALERERPPTLSPALEHRIRSEYAEMPCLRLTLPQAARFWNVDADVCRVVLDRLVADGFLTHGRNGYGRVL